MNSTEKRSIQMCVRSVLVISCVLLCFGWVQMNAKGLSGEDIWAISESDYLTEGDYKYVVQDGKIVITDYLGHEKNLVIPNKIAGFPVTILFSLGDSMREFESIKLPDSLEEIGDAAFGWCNQLTTIHLPKNVKKVSPIIFFGLQYLESITVDPQNDYFTSIQGVLYTKDLKTLVRFPSNFQFAQINYPKELESIGEYAFWGTYQIGELILPSTIRRIEEEAFGAMSFFKKLTLPAELEYIGKSAFSDCSLETLELPNKLKFIGEGAFSISRLRKLTIPASVLTIENSIFEENYYIQEINVAEANPNYASVAGVLFNKSKDQLLQFPCGNTMKNYTVPTTVKTISDWAFYNSAYVKTITIGENITQLGADVFKNSNATLLGYAGSYIETYAANRNLKFMPINVSAKSSPINVEVEGKKVTVEGYMINNTSYFKLRDLAYLLQNSRFKFDVSWNTHDKVVTILQQTSYIPVGGELAVLKVGEVVSVPMSPMKVAFGDTTLTLRAYTIHGNNYIKLRDLSDLLGMTVTWDEKLKTIKIK